MRTVRALTVALGFGSLAAACWTDAANDACPGDCGCFATPESCPVGCYPIYDILPDGGGTGQFLCSNVPGSDIEAQTPDAANGGAPPACPGAGGASSSGSVAEADLPSGACSAGQFCLAEVEAPSCAGAVDGWTCSCTAGIWTCLRTSVAAGPCVQDGAAE